MRWLLDEGIPRPIAEWLRDRGDDVLVVALSRHRAASDRVLWDVAAREERFVMTRDRGFVQLFSDAAPPGVVVVRTPDYWRADEITSLVAGYLEQVQPLALQGALTILEVGRVRQRPLSKLGK